MTSVMLWIPLIDPSPLCMYGGVAVAAQSDNLSNRLP